MKRYTIKLYICCMLPELQLTKDQSHTLYVPELDETYHSRNGAVEEAMYVYIGRGLQDWITKNSEQPKSTINILEIGFGTGLNAWLTAMAAERMHIQCNYHSLETLPLPEHLIHQLNYTEQHSSTEQQLYTTLHQVEWNQMIAINSIFSLYKHEVSLLDFKPETAYDIIYFDAFAPEKQPELWTRDCFDKLFHCLNPNGIIVTYSSKGDIKRLWREIGFEVERLPGPPKKRHMLRGRKVVAKEESRK